MNNTILTLSAVSAAILLTACGGGSSGDTPVISQPSAKVTVKGTAVDELILNGIVKVNKPDAALLIEGRTDTAKGTYALDVANYIGPVIVNVTCDADSKLLIGTTEEACPVDLDLNSVANADGTEVTVNVSPLTEITYQRAVNLGGGQITEDSVTQASNQIATMFGVDPIRNDPTTGTYAATIEAFHAVAEADPERDLFDVIDDFAEDANDGVVEDSAALVGALAAAGVTNPLTISGDEPYAVPSNPAPTDDVAQVKAMVKDLRTQATTIASYAENEAEAMGTALEDATLDVQSASELVVGIAELVMQAREDGITVSSGPVEVSFNGEWTQIPASVTQSTVNPNEWIYRAKDYTGTIILPEITEGMENTFTSLTAAFNGTLPYVDDIYSQTPVITTQTVTLDLALTKTAEGADVTLSDFTIENSGNSVSISNLRASVGYAANQTFNYLKLHEITLSGTVGNYAATGTLTVPSYAVNTSLAARGGVQEVATTYAYVDMYCSYPSTINNPSATLSIDGTDYTYNANHTGSDYAFLNLDNIAGDYTYAQIEAATQATATCSNGSTPNVNVNTWNDSEELIGNSGHIPSKLSFVGSLKNTATNGELSGSVNVELLNATSLDLTSDMSETNEPALKVDLSGTFVIPQRPDTLVNMSYETQVDDDAHRHSVTGSYAHATTTLTVDGSVDKTAENGQLTFTDGAGVVAKFILANDSFVSGNAAASTGSLVTKDGRVVATIEERGDNIIIIKYLDGSFESIF